MKILRISLRNIASLAGEHTVDFTKAPLATAGLFSISGPTGSGKSTLLDALCLALYDETPRMAAVAGAAAVLDGGKEVQQRDVRNLLRRGCGEGFAEVAFVGIDGLTYTACWVARRAQAKADRALQRTEHSLWRGNAPHGTNRISAADGTATEIKREIAAKVGLTFDQFRRAVLLAQGDFATFLKARDTERAEILQALTGTERFEKISIAVYERHKREEAAVQTLRDQLGAALPLSPEDRAQAEEELASATTRHREITQALGVRNKQREWFQGEAEHRRKLGEASEAVSRFNALVEANAGRTRELQWIRTVSMEAGSKRAAEKQAYAAREDATERVRVLTQRDSALSQEVDAAVARHQAATQALEDASKRQRELAVELAKARALDGELAQQEQAASLARAEHARALDAFHKADGDLRALQSGLAALAKTRERFEQCLARLEPFAPFARDREMWLERFQTEQRLRAKKEQLARRIDSTAKLAAKVGSRLDQFRSTLHALRMQRDESETAWKRAAEMAALFHPEELLSQRRKATALQAELQKLRAHLANQKRLLVEHQAIADSLTALQAEITAENLLQKQLEEKRLPEAIAISKQARESLRLAEAAASEHAVVLRQTLVRGEACPVCGSREHPHAAGAGTLESAVLKALKREAECAEQTLDLLRADLAAAKARSDEKNKQDKKLGQDLKWLEKQVAEAGAYGPQLEEVAVLFRKPPAQRDAALDRREAETAELLRDLDRRDEERLKADKNRMTLRERFDHAAQVLQNAEKTEAEALNAHTAVQIEHANAHTEGIALEKEHAAALDAVSPVVSALPRGAAGSSPEEARGLVWDYAQNPEAFCDGFDAGAREYLAVTQQLEGTVQEEKTRHPLLGNLTAVAATARDALSARRAAQDAAQHSLEKKRAQRNALLGGRAVTDAEHAGAADFEAAKNREQHTGKDLADAKNKRSSNRELLEDQQKRAVSLEESLRKAREALESWMRNFATREGEEIDRDRMDAWLGRDPQWIEREQRELDDVRQRLSLALGAESMVRRQLEDHAHTKTTRDDLETIESDLLRLEAEAKLALDAAHAKRAVVWSDDARKRQTGELSRKLEDQCKQADPWQKLNHLIGSADGTRFRNMAQQWTLEILLRHANAQLALLSGRYRLERLRDSLNLLVTDLEMDGQQRSVHSLSGGESFLVSLGLALGLASLTSSRLLIESLFIDEGFGSLDSETLRVALNALSHLESQGRKVGVISHVSEMVDAIPVQVRVVRGPGGASKIVV